MRSVPGSAFIKAPSSRMVPKSPLQPYCPLPFCSAQRLLSHLRPPAHASSTSVSVAYSPRHLCSPLRLCCGPVSSCSRVSRRCRALRSEGRRTRSRQGHRCVDGGAWRPHRALHGLVDLSRHVFALTSCNGLSCSKRLKEGDGGSDCSEETRLRGP